MSRQTQVLEILKLEKKFSDRELSKALRTSVKNIQTAVFNINTNNKKFKDYSIIREGNICNYNRELISRQSDENEMIESADEDGKKALRKLDSRRKKVLIAISTRDGEKNRMRFMQQVLQQNLNMAVEAQRLLQ